MDSNAGAPILALALIGLIGLVLSIFGPILALDTPTQPRVVCPSVRESVDATVAALAQATAESYATRDAAWADHAATQDANQ